MENPPVRLDDMIEAVKSMNPDGDALDRLADAVRVSERLGELADHLVGHFVDQARRNGASWTDIGQSMGVTKQAAQKRFVPRQSDEGDIITSSAFARFTDRARRTVVTSQLLARKAGSPTITPEHILVALLEDQEGFASQAITALGSDVDGIRPAAVAAYPEAGEQHQSGHIPFTPLSKKLLERTIRESLRLGHSYVGTEHILLGMLHDTEAPAGRILAEHGIERQATEAWLLERLSAI
jgi:hypothetical protein